MSTRRINLPLLFLAPLGLLLAAGCGSSADSLMRQQIDAMNDLADAVEKGASESEMTAIKSRMESIAEKMEKLSPSDAEKKRLMEKYKDDMAKATGRMMQAMMGQMGGALGQAMGEAMGGPGGMPNIPMPNLPTP